MSCYCKNFLFVIIVDKYYTGKLLLDFVKRWFMFFET